MEQITRNNLARFGVRVEFKNCTHNVQFILNLNQSEKHIYGVPEIPGHAVG